MDMIYSIECVSSSDGMEDDDALSSNLPRPFLKASAAAIVAASIGVVPGGGGGASGAGAAGGIAGPLIPPATSVHELLECPVCTNSMYPPIHQVSASCPGVVSVSWFLGCLLEPRCRSTTSSSPISRLKQKTEKQAVVVAPSASPSVLDLWMAQYAWPYEDEC